MVLWLESERMAFLKIDDDSFYTERSVVEEERRMGINAPYGTVLERVLPTIFKDSTYRWATIGHGATRCGFPYRRSRSGDGTLRSRRSARSWP